MNKKLLSSSALVGAMLISGAALAEFKVSGDITATYVMGSDDTGSTGTNGKASGETIGNEFNIIMSGSSDLNNGMKAKYSGKLEFDGVSTSEPDHEYELKLESANGFYVAFANDGGQSNRTSMTPFVSYPIGSVGFAVAGATASTSSGGGFAGDSFISGVHQSNNIGFGGKIGGGDFVLRYAPNTAKVNGNDITTTGGGVTADATGATGSGYMMAYNGKFDALGLNASYTVEQKDDTNIATEGEAKEKRIGFNYTMGAVKVGADYIKYTDGSTAKSTDRTTTIVGLAYAADKNTTVGAYMQTTEADIAAGGLQDEDMKMLTLGYNLGAGSVALSIVDVQGFGNAATSTGADYQGLVLATKVGF